MGIVDQKYETGMKRGEARFEPEGRIQALRDRLVDLRDPRVEFEEDAVVPGMRTRPPWPSPRSCA